MKSIQDRYIEIDANNMRAPLFSVLKASCQYDVRIRSVNKRKLIDVKGNSLIDFASCNYLSFDLDTDRLLNAGMTVAKKFGVHTSRARLMSYHELFTQVETRLAKHIGVEDTVLYSKYNPDRHWNYPCIVAGTVKGLSAAAAFASVTHDMKEYLMAYAKPLDYTHPPPLFAIGVLDEALSLLQEVGNIRRENLYRLSDRLIKGLRSIGLYVMNNTNFPIISVWVGDTDRLIKASQFLFQKGIFLTSCPYPTMARGREALRITVTSNNTNEEIDHLLNCFESLVSNWRSQRVAFCPE